MTSPLNGDAIALLLLAWLALGVLAMLVCGAVAYRIGKPATKLQGATTLRSVRAKKLSRRDVTRSRSRT